MGRRQDDERSEDVARRDRREDRRWRPRLGRAGTISAKSDHIVLILSAAFGDPHLHRAGLAIGPEVVRHRGQRRRLWPWAASSNRARLPRRRERGAWRALRASRRRRTGPPALFASIGAARLSSSVWTGCAGIVGLLDAIDERTSPQRHPPDVHAHAGMRVQALGRHWQGERHDVAFAPAAMDRRIAAA